MNYWATCWACGPFCAAWPARRAVGYSLAQTLGLAIHMPPLSEIAGQPLSMLVCNHQICKNCGVIDRDYGRLKKGHRCKHCQAESEAGRLVFPINIHVLVDLVQQAYHSQSPTAPLDAPQGQDVGTVLFYCSLREALLNTFIINNLRARNIDEALISRMLDDNKLASQKFGGLFTSVIGVKWNEAISELNRLRKEDYAAVSDLMREAAELRNEFLHEGKAWGINRELAKRCVDSVCKLMSMFVALHNEYTQPLLHSEA